MVDVAQTSPSQQPLIMVQTAPAAPQPATSSWLAAWVGWRRTATSAPSATRAWRRDVIPAKRRARRSNGWSVMAVLASESPSSPIGATGILACRSVVLRGALAVWSPLGEEVFPDRNGSVLDLGCHDVRDLRDLAGDVGRRSQGQEPIHDHAGLHDVVHELDGDLEFVGGGQNREAFGRIGQMIEGEVVAHEDPPRVGTLAAPEHARRRRGRGPALATRQHNGRGPYIEGRRPTGSSERPGSWGSGYHRTERTRRT